MHIVGSPFQPHCRGGYNETGHAPVAAQRSSRPFGTHRSAKSPKCRAQPRNAITQSQDSQEAFFEEERVAEGSVCGPSTQSSSQLDLRQQSAGFGGGLEEEFSSFREGIRLPTQGESLVKGIEPRQSVGLAEKPPDLDFLQELIAMQQNGPKNIGFFGTRNMGFMHQNLIEVLSYAMVLTGNHIFTSGATGTNAAVIRGAIRAENPELLTVVLPQSLDRQPPESQELLGNVKAENLIEMPQNNGLPLGEASRICNRDIVGRVQQVICFAFHDSNLLLETCREASENRKMVTLFYLD